VFLLQKLYNLTNKLQIILFFSVSLNAERGNRTIKEEYLQYYTVKNIKEAK